MCLIFINLKKVNTLPKIWTIAPVEGAYTHPQSPGRFNGNHVSPPVARVVNGPDNAIVDGLFGALPSMYLQMPVL